MNKFAKTAYNFKDISINIKIAKDIEELKILC